ncbi:hypothetical protein CVU76_02570 [Candidatus Dojkabacteria bacterium HGW-Dojkabacteria-1]|uniref:DUF5667 domain-containing protein n=1 Tax=Candidatus Dojkabacteria bacterium HGW-Dojkabacteria-1 TaxID=2013761 RepID=A0A2N2F409_9BACT|nr:MAG: hypothetical protein CVU76_02570 [Candidatus Dojkabacteria bacterium HGW-Dojkabacteria-1]
MKKIFLLLTLSILLVSPNFVLAQEDLEVENPKVDTISMFFNDLYERVQLLFTFNEDAKFEKRMEFAERKLAQIEELRDVVDEETLKKLEERYEYQMQKAEEMALKREERQQERLQRILEARERHILRLLQVSEQVPEEAKDSLDMVIEKSLERYESIPEKIQENLQKKEGVNIDKPLPEKVRKTPEEIEEYKRLLRESKLQENN